MIPFCLCTLHVGQLSLNEPLVHDHVVYSFMEASDLLSADPPQAQSGSQWWGDGGTMAPEVGLLSRSIIIQGITAHICNVLN